jgi:hypothetical protein
MSLEEKIQLKKPRKKYKSLYYLTLEENNDHKGTIRCLQDELARIKSVLAREGDNIREQMDDGSLPARKYDGVNECYRLSSLSYECFFAWLNETASYGGSRDMIPDPHPFKVIFYNGIPVMHASGKD